MRFIYAKLLIISLGLSGINSYAQNYRYTDTEMKAADMPPNFIGAELPADKKYYFKTASGKDSVLLASYTIYHWDKKRVYTLDGTLSPATKPPHFKGTLAEGKMLEGELYFEDTYYNNEYLYKGSFADNRANGIAIFKVTSRQASISPVECKAIFENGLISKRGLLKLDFDSAGVPVLFFNGEIMLGYGNQILIKDGYGSFFSTNHVKPAFNRLYGLGVANAYYEGQVINGLRTGYGIYNTYDYKSQKTTNFKAGLLLADFPVTQFSSLPFGVEALGKKIERNEGLYSLLPDISSANIASFIYDNRSYMGMQYNKKPYGFGVMKDADGFYETGFWKDGVRIPTEELLKKVLPDSGLLHPNQVINKVVRVTTKYNSKKNKYINEEETTAATISYYGKLNNAGEIEGWGFRTGGYTTEAGYFLPTKLVSNKKLELPKPADVFKTGYVIKQGDGSEQGYIIEKNRYRFYTRTNFYASQIVPYGEIPLKARDTNTIALSEYRDKRDYEVEGYKAYIAKRIEEDKLKEAERDKLFLRLENPSKADITGCISNFYMERSGKYLYSVWSVDAKNNFKVTRYNVNVPGMAPEEGLIPANEFLSSGKFRKVQRYVRCRFCNGTGKVTNSYSYTADYEYTYGAKIKSSYTQTSNCSCGGGLVPEQFGAKVDW